MKRLVAQIQALVRELRRRQVIRVAVVYATTAFVILQIGEILVDPFGLGGWALRLVLFLLVLGFPLAIGLAWVYNVTEEGVVREIGDETAGEEAAAQGSPFTSNGLIVGLLIIAIGLLLYPRVFLSGEETAEQVSTAAPDTAQVDERSIAVLPFTNLSGDEETRPVARGLHDDLLTRLSNVGDLQVISRTSVEHYRDTDLTLPAIADSLGVRWIVEGGVQQSGGQIQVNAQLIDPRSDVHRWAESYQRELSAEDLFAIQGEIAQEIAGALEAKLTAGEQDRLTGAPTRNLDAYRLYVQGRRELAQRRFYHNEHLERAAQHFQRAIEQDSSFALAWAGLADAASARIRDVPDTSVIRTIDQEAAARRALKLDPDLAEAHASMGHVHYVSQNAPAALRELKRALELKPSYWEAHQMLGWVYFILDRPGQALEHFQLAVDLNPEHARARHGLYDAYIFTGQFRKALREARRQKQMGLEEENAAAGQVRALMQLGRLEEARRLAEKQIETLGPETVWGGWFRVYLVYILAEQGDTTGAERYLEQVRQAEVSSTHMASAYLGLGDAEKALGAVQQIEWSKFDALRSQIDMFLLRYLGEKYPSIRQDPRYQETFRWANRAWGLNPDGSLPENIDVSTGPADP
jgi:TolB-like protein